MAEEKEKSGKPLNGTERELEHAVDRTTKRREQWERTGEWPVARALAMMGRFGWTIVVPMLLGAFFGRWLDEIFDSGVFFSAALVFLGAVIGFVTVWKRMHID
jgi:ATP synthase protein I